MNRYDDRARLVFHFAREEAEKLSHPICGPEHLLLGLLREGGIAANVLTSFGMTLESARQQVREMVGISETFRFKDIFSFGKKFQQPKSVTITLRARRVMELAASEAHALGSQDIKVEHILLGILTEGDGVAYRMIQIHERDPERVKARVLQFLQAKDPSQDHQPTPNYSNKPINRYDDRARPVFHFARDEGRLLAHAMIGPEHLLLGIMREDGEAAKVLAESGMTLAEMRARVEEMVGRGDGLPHNETAAITPRARRVMELAGFEALNLGKNVVQVEHILLGILKEGDGVAYKIIQSYQDVDVVRKRLLELEARAEETIEVAGPVGIVGVIKAHKTVYLAIKHQEDFGEFPFVDTLSRDLQNEGFATLCAARDIENWGTVLLEPRELMQKTLRLIDASDVVLIDLSEKGVGLGIEAGYAYPKGKPIITIAKQGAAISATLRGISKHVRFYNTTEELANLLVNLIL